MALIDLYNSLFGRSNIKDGTVIEMAEHGRAGGLSTGQPFKFSRDVEEKTAIDAVSASVTYLGKAALGTATSSAGWQIKRVSVSGNVTTISYADGDDKYDNVWDDRASLSYS